MAYKKLSANLKKRKSGSSAVKRKKEPLSKKKSRVKVSPKRKKLAKRELLIKPKDNLIMMPIADHDWEAWQVFNPGVIALEDRIHFIYRAIGVDGISRFGYASSSDGFLIDERLPYPVYEHPSLNSGLNYYSFGSGGSFGGAEDARLTRVDNEDNIFMTYTACDEGLRVALTSIKVGDFLKKIGNGKSRF